uniref:Uncharacterized protein n=1 Tax=Rhizophora mucronata TaxID=61149 RepID=A0A2P2NV40_RHIMU
MCSLFSSKHLQFWFAVLFKFKIPIVVYCADLLNQQYCLDPSVGLVACFLQFFLLLAC